MTEIKDAVTFDVSAEQAQKIEKLDAKKVRLPLAVTEGQLVVSTGLRCGPADDFVAVNAPFKIARA